MERAQCSLQELLLRKPFRSGIPAIDMIQLVSDLGGVHYRSSKAYTYLEIWVIFYYSNFKIMRQKLFREMPSTVEMHNFFLNLFYFFAGKAFELLLDQKVAHRDIKPMNILVYGGPNVTEKCNFIFKLWVFIHVWISHRSTINLQLHLLQKMLFQSGVISGQLDKRHVRTILATPLLGPFPLLWVQRFLLKLDRHK